MTDPLAEATFVPPFLADVIDRPAFWAELGAVSGPMLLARLGSRCVNVGQLAADAELQAAMKVAARHVREHCVVWGGQGGRYSDEQRSPVSSPSTGRSSLGLQGPRERWLPPPRPLLSPRQASAFDRVEPLPLYAHEAVDVVEDETEPGGPPVVARSRKSFRRMHSGGSSGSSDSEGMSDEELNTASTDLVKTLPLQSVCRWIPGLGHRRSNIISAVVVIIVGTFYMTSWMVNGPVSRISENSTLSSNHIGSGGAKVVQIASDLSAGVCLLVTIPMLRSISRLCRSLSMRQLLLREEYFASNHALRRLAAEAAFLGGVVFLMHFLKHCRDITMHEYEVSMLKGLWRILDFLAWGIYDLAAGVYFAVFTLLCRMLVKGNQRLAARAGDDTQFKNWAAFLVEYRDWHTMVGRLWSFDCFGMATTVTMFLGVIDIFWRIVHTLSTTKHTDKIIMCMTVGFSALCYLFLLFMMGAVRSTCHSLRPSSESIFLGASHQYGQVPRGQSLDHHHFVCMVRDMPTLIEVRPLGVITRKFAIGATRAMIIIFPLCVSLAVRFHVETPL